MVNRMLLFYLGLEIGAGIGVFAAYFAKRAWKSVISGATASVDQVAKDLVSPCPRCGKHTIMLPDEGEICTPCQVAVEDMCANCGASGGTPQCVDCGNSHWMRKMEEERT